MTSTKQQKIAFDKRIAFLYGLATGIFLGITLGVRL